MYHSDKVLKCVDCKEDFVFSGKDQKFYEQKKFSEPKRCKPCREANKVRIENERARGSR